MKNDDRERMLITKRHLRHGDGPIPTWRVKALLIATVRLHVIQGNTVVPPFGGRR